MQEGDLVASIPGKFILSANQDELLSSTLNKKEYIEFLDGYVALAIRILREISKGAESQWAPYLATIPNTFETTTYWDPEDFVCKPFIILCCISC